MISEEIKSKRALPRRELSEEERQFLLTNEEVLDRIVEGLIKDLKSI
ncbi:MAG: hypothetical protein ABJR05_03465 [Balneola sp.]